MCADTCTVTLLPKDRAATRGRWTSGRLNVPDAPRPHLRRLRVGGTSSCSWRDVAPEGAVATGHPDVGLGRARDAPCVLLIHVVERRHAPAREQRILVAWCRDRVRDLVERLESVAAHERVAVWQCRDEPAGARGEVLGGDARVDPHDPVREACEALHLTADEGRVAALPAVGEDDDD